MFKVYESPDEVICISCAINGVVDKEEYDEFFTSGGRNIDDFETPYIATSISISNRLAVKAY